MSIVELLQEEKSLHLSLEHLHMFFKLIKINLLEKFVLTKVLFYNKFYRIAITKMKDCGIFIS